MTLRGGMGGDFCVIAGGNIFTPVPDHAGMTPPLQDQHTRESEEFTVGFTMGSDRGSWFHGFKATPSGVIASIAP